DAGGGQVGEGRQVGGEGVPGDLGAALQFQRFAPGGRGFPRGGRRRAQSAAGSGPDGLGPAGAGPCRGERQLAGLWRQRRGAACWPAGRSVRRTKLLRLLSGTASVVIFPVSGSTVWTRSRLPAAGAAGRGRAPTSQASSWTRPLLLLTLMTGPSSGAAASARRAAASARPALALAASALVWAAATASAACPAQLPASPALWAAFAALDAALDAWASTWATNCSYRVGEGGS